MAHEIDYQLIGDDMQLVEVTLDQNETVRAEAGTMMYMDQDIKMETGTSGGLLKGFKRMFTGESFFITSFTNEGQNRQKVGFASPYPGKIIPIDLGELPDGFICQKDAFLCAAFGVEIEVTFTKKIGAGIFGGEGFILQHLKGDGLAFVHAGGTIIERRLVPGETLRVDTGCVVGFEPTINYDVNFIGGFKNALFGGEGLFLVNLTGPGRVFLQSLPFSKLVDRVNAALPPRSSND